ncbi:MAG: methyl-accepting chemotaxis protein [Rhizobiaceae bacterium]|nr:methyl-accepting chemotaxis protein [Rhizobiaceae bacterium]
MKIENVMKFTNLKTKTKILIGISAPLTLLVFLGGTSLLSINKIVDSNKSVEHTHEVLEHSAAIIGSAVDMETGMRGYLLAGKEDFLSPYKGGEKATYEGIDELSVIVDDNPAQVARLEAAKKVLQEWQKDVTEPTINLRRKIGDAQTMNDLSTLIKEARGKVYFDKFREQIKLFDSRERVFLVKRSEEYRTAEHEVAQDLKYISIAANELNHTNKVLTAVNELTSHAVSMEAGFRGYLLAGKDEFLDPYKSEGIKFSTQIKSLEFFVSDEPAQVERLKGAEQLMSDWQKQVAEPAIALRKRVNIGQAQLLDIEALVGRKQGENFFHEFQQLMAEFVDVESDLLIEREKHSRDAEARVKKHLTIMNENEQKVEHTYKVLGVANEILGAAVDMETGMRGYLLAGEETFLAPYTAGVATFASKLASLSITVSDNPAQVKLLGEIRNTVDEWRGKVVEPTLDLRRKIGSAKTMDDMADLIGEAHGKEYFDRFREIMTKFESVEQGLMTQRSAANSTTVSFTNILIMACVIGALILGGLVAWFIGNSIANPITRMTSAMRRLANGENETEVIGIERGDEIGEMAGAVQVFKENAIRNLEMEAETIENKKLAEQREEAARDQAIEVERQMVDDVFGRALAALAAKNLEYRITEDLPPAYHNLRDNYHEAVNELSSTIGQIREASAEILSGSGEIHQSANDLSSRSEQQAAAVEETAAALEETTNALNTSAERAVDAGKLVSTTTSNAEQSGKIVRQAIVAMREIEKSSDEIASIIGVIDDIAFQTNLLALNAGVEAARAGDSGRGFAVVAQEVRELAQRSASAAKEIKQLITTSGGEVKAGAELVDQTGAALDVIVSEVAEINEHVAAIASAANEQSVGLREINESVNSIDQGTQQNAAVAEQTTAASFELNKQVTKIDDMLKEFSTGKTTPKKRVEVVSNKPLEVVGSQAMPQPSPARALKQKVAQSFNRTAAAVNEDPWQDY